MSDDISLDSPSSAGERGVLRSMQEVAMSSQEASKMLRTYNIAWWGNNYYDVNELGHISVCPDPDVPQARVDLAELVKAREAQGQRLPALFCFPQILQHRLRSINAAFKRARESYGYNGDYFLVYPIKVNQHRRVIESLIHSGEPLGLEAGSKAQLMAVLAHAGMTRSVIVCNGYKDREYIRLALVHVVGIGIDGAFRIGSDDLHGSVGNVLQVSAGAGDGAAGADAGHEMRDLMVGGLPDFRAGGVVVAFRAVRIVVLVRAIAAGNRLGEAFGHLIIGTRVVRTGVGGGHDHFGPIGAQYGALGFGDLVGQGEDGTVTALLRHQSQTYAGVAGGRLHDHPAGLQFAASLGRIDDAFGDAVLGRTARIEVFDLDRDGGLDAVGHMVEFDERGVADEFGQGIVDGHGVSFVQCGFGGFRYSSVVFVVFEKLAMSRAVLKRDSL